MQDTLEYVFVEYNRLLDQVEDGDLSQEEYVDRIDSLLWKIIEQYSTVRPSYRPSDRTMTFESADNDHDDSTPLSSYPTNLSLREALATAGQEVRGGPEDRSIERLVEASSVSMPQQRSASSWFSQTMVQDPPAGDLPLPFTSDEDVVVDEDLDNPAQQIGEDYDDNA